MKLSKKVKRALKEQCNKYGVEFNMKTLEVYEDVVLSGDLPIDVVEELLTEYKDPNTKELIAGAYIKGSDGKYELLLDRDRDINLVGWPDGEHYYVMGVQRD